MPDPITHDDLSLDNLAATWTERLRQDGYCVIPSLVPGSVPSAVFAELAERFDLTPFCDGEFYGRRTKRFGSVLKRSRASWWMIQQPLVLAIAEQVLRPECDCIQLNLAQALQLHPGQVDQPPHRDEDMWGGPKGQFEYLVNVMWPLSDYTRENGATLVFPGSHADRRLEGFDDPVAVEMVPGDALLMLGSTLHCGGSNSSDGIRSGLLVSYCLGWLKPFENQWLAYPPDVARGFPADLAGLVGYRQHRPNLGNYEGQCPSILLQDRAPDYLPARDALTEPQQAAIRRFRENPDGR